MTCSLLAIAVIPVCAQEGLSLQVTVSAVTPQSELFRPNGQPADFLGVGLTQTVGDIRKILTGQGFSDANSATLFLLDEEYFTVEIVATGANRYPTYAIWSGPEDATASQSVRVEFASPLTGQRSTDVRRFVSYKDGRGPLLETLRSAIIAKYGAPSVDNETQMTWFWNHGQLVKSGAHDKQMTIGMETASDYVKRVAYSLADIAASNADRDAVNGFRESVEQRAKAVRDGHATTPKL
ncbi:hypothetical protein [Mesorhizobium sophorae]|uniref:hypothetical protein n=1 Tax=Mesorhizobium sophorae TaxID=1300294 RepID=UPI00197E104D|nr:hypothetical protein [Mesorhizobium sophorae]